MPESLTINRKEQILSEASKLFREKGYAVATMRDIAAAMGIEAASLYHHIKSKEEILELICFNMADQFINALKEVNDIYFNAEEKLKMAIRAHVQIITGNIDQSAVFIHEWKGLAEDKRIVFKTLRDKYENELRVILTEGKNEDVFDDVNEKFAALTILSAVNWIYQWYNPGGDMSPDEIADTLSDFILGGLRKKRVTDINYKP